MLGIFHVYMIQCPGELNLSLLKISGWQSALRSVQFEDLISSCDFLANSPEADRPCLVTEPVGSCLHCTSQHSTTLMMMLMLVRVVMVVVMMVVVIMVRIMTMMVTRVCGLLNGDYDDDADDD